MSVFLSCEQGGHLMPPELSCRGDLTLPSALVDPAWGIAGELSQLLGVTLIRNEFASTLIDVRRSTHHRDLFGKKTRNWSQEDRQLLLDEIYAPYREKIRKTISEKLSQNAYVVHLSVQTFGFRSKSGKVRRTDVGLSYDPARDDEVDFCLDWIDEMYETAAMLKVRRNYPRRGTHDSLTKAMRTEFQNQPYLGIELMLGRAWTRRKVALRTEAIQGMATALRYLVNDATSRAA